MSGASSPPKQASTEPSVSPEITAIADGIRVVSEGFAFYVVYRTKFGQNRRERLDAAFKNLQEMGVFKPHINLQRTGVRLVMTRWDGSDFTEEAAIDNMEHSTPEEVEVLLKRCLHTSSDSDSASAASTPSSQTRPKKVDGVASVEIKKRPRDQWFHFVIHRQSGKTEEGPLLTRANVTKLQGERFFPPGVVFHMMALNERVRIERPKGDGAEEASSDEVFPLKTEEDARAIEAVLNPLFAAASDAPPKPVAEPSPSSEASAESPRSESSESEPPDEALSASKPEPKPEVKAEPKPAAAPAPKPVGSGGASPSSTAKAPEPKAKADSAAKPAGAPQPAESQEKSAATDGLSRQLEATATLPPHQAAREAFEAVRTHWNLPPSTNEHGYSELRIRSASGAENKLVLTPRFMVFETADGYIRFGSESRVFSKRTDDYVEFPKAGLRGVSRSPAEGVPRFLVSQEFLSFFNRAGKDYKEAFGSWLSSAPPLPKGDEIVWPASREESLFQGLLSTARRYGLPVDSDESRITLQPEASHFVGFQKTNDPGIAFFHGEDCVKFTAEGVELRYGGEVIRREGDSGLAGWGLDQRGKMCAIVRSGSELESLGENKLVRFVTEADAKTEQLNILAYQASGAESSV